MKEYYVRKNCKITLNGESFDLNLTKIEFTPSGVVFKAGSDLLFVSGVAATTLAATHGSPINAAINGILATGVLLAGSTKLLNFGKYNYSAIDGVIINQKMKNYYNKIRALEVKKLNSNDSQFFELKQKQIAANTVNFLEKEYIKANKLINEYKNTNNKINWPFEGPAFSVALDNEKGIKKFIYYNKDYLTNIVPNKKEFIESVASKYKPDFDYSDYNVSVLGLLIVKDDTIKSEELINKNSKIASNKEM